MFKKLKYNELYIMNMMELKPLIDEIEEIKAGLFMLEVKLIEMENPEKEDVEAIAEVLKEFLEGKTFTFDPFNPDKHFL